ncbi:MAG: hypothetical protein ACREE7_10025 [Dongiaceae bacterium]
MPSGTRIIPPITNLTARRHMMGSIPFEDPAAANTPAQCLGLAEQTGSKAIFECYLISFSEISSCLEKVKRFEYGQRGSCSFISRS